MPYSELDKLQHEVEKLILEIRTLKRPFILQPTAWFTMIGLVISISVNISQCTSRKNEETLSEIKVREANLKKIEIQHQTDSLLSIKSGLQKDSADLKLRNDNAIAQIEINEARLSAVSDSLNRLLNNFGSLTASQAASSIKNVKDAVQRINTVSQETKENFSAANTTSAQAANNKLAVAKQKEREGFQALLDDNFQQAAAAFQAAENAYNGYHWVYELARFMKANQDETDPTKRAAVIETVVSRYSKGAPPDLLAQLKKKMTSLP